MTRWIITLFLTTILLLGQRSIGQNKFSLSGGFGYKTNSSEFVSLMFNYRPNKRIEFSIGPSIHYIFAGQGATTSMKIYYPTDKKIFLNTEVAYRHLFSTKLSISPVDHESEVGNYSIPSNDFLFIGEGINFIVKNNTTTGKTAKINFTLCYGIPFKTYISTFTSGIESADIEKQINNRITGGFGFSISYCVDL